MHVTVYTKPGCHLCDDALQLVDKLTPRYDLDVTEVNILDDINVYMRYKLLIPVIEVTDVSVGQLSAPVTEAAMQAYFLEASKALPGSTHSTQSKKRFLPFARSSNPSK